jgi:hypothetical protein
MKMLQITSKLGIYDVKLDDADYERIAMHCWSVLRSGKKIYIRRDLWFGRGLSRERVYLHRAVWGDVPDGQYVDHISGDTLDNRRCNLRLATGTQNQANRLLSRTSTSGFKGVYFRKATGKWSADLRAGKRHISLGSFSTPEEAANAYDIAAVEHFGEFARTNAMIRGEGK